MNIDTEKKIQNPRSRRDRRHGKGRNSKRNGLGAWLGKSLKRKVWFAVIVAVIIGAVIAITPIVSNSLRESTITTESQLQKAVNVSELSSAKFAYNGIAVKKDDKGNDEYHIKYESTVTASFQMNGIRFDEDALEAVKKDADIKSIATENLKKTVEALTKPIVDGKGYTLTYEEQTR